MLCVEVDAPWSESHDRYAAEALTGLCPDGLTSAWRRRLDSFRSGHSASKGFFISAHPAPQASAVKLDLRRATINERDNRRGKHPHPQTGRADKRSLSISPSSAVEVAYPRKTTVLLDQSDRPLKKTEASETLQRMSGRVSQTGEDCSVLIALQAPSMNGQEESNSLRFAAFLLLAAQGLSSPGANA